MNTITLKYTQDVPNLPMAAVPQGTGTPPYPPGFLKFATIPVFFGELEQLGMIVRFAVTQGGVISNNSTLVTGLASTAALYVGQPAVGDGIPDGTYVFAIPSPTSIIMSQDATKSGAISIGFLDDTTAYSAGALTRTIVLTTTALGDSLWGGDVNFLKAATVGLYSGTLAARFPGNTVADAPLVT